MLYLLMHHGSSFVIRHFVRQMQPVLGRRTGTCPLPYRSERRYADPEAGKAAAKLEEFFGRSR